VQTVVIANRHYITSEARAEFERRAKAGELRDVPKKQEAA
jgi:hypothetical protein